MTIVQGSETINTNNNGDVVMASSFVLKSKKK